MKEDTPMSNEKVSPDVTGEMWAELDNCPRYPMACECEPPCIVCGFNKHVQLHTLEHPFTDIDHPEDYCGASASAPTSTDTDKSSVQHDSESLSPSDVVIAEELNPHLHRRTSMKCQRCKRAKDVRKLYLGEVVQTDSSIGLPFQKFGLSGGVLEVCRKCYNEWLAAIKTWFELE